MALQLRTKLGVCAINCQSLMNTTYSLLNDQSRGVKRHISHHAVAAIGTAL
jgi:hypothetical protein